MRPAGVQGRGGCPGGADRRPCSSRRKPGTGGRSYARTGCRIQWRPPGGGRPARPGTCGAAYLRAARFGRVPHHHEAAAVVRDRELEDHAGERLQAGMKMFTFLGCASPGAAMSRGASSAGTGEGAFAPACQQKRSSCSRRVLGRFHFTASPGRRHTGPAQTRVAGRHPFVSAASTPCPFPGFPSAIRVPGNRRFWSCSQEGGPPRAHGLEGDLVEADLQKIGPAAGALRRDAEDHLSEAAKAATASPTRFWWRDRSTGCRQNTAVRRRGAAGRWAPCPAIAPDAKCQERRSPTTKSIGGMGGDHAHELGQVRTRAGRRQAQHASGGRAPAGEAED